WAFSPRRVADKAFSALSPPTLFSWILNILPCRGAVASLPTLIFLNFEPPTSSGYAAFSSNKKTAAVSNNLTAAVFYR
uniref:hypothetical protein n=1 Tax=Alloprevotella sp. TaxID=1872471 RepID=UPI003FED870B